jgi:hypothetical protein
MSQISAVATHGGFSLFCSHSGNWSEGLQRVSLYIKVIAYIVRGGKTTGLADFAQFVATDDAGAAAFDNWDQDNWGLRDIVPNVAYCNLTVFSFSALCPYFIFDR